MDTILLRETEDTPNVKLDSAKGTIFFEGKCFPENADDFFMPLLRWVRGYTQEKEIKEVVFKLEYFNTASSKKILELFLMFQQLMQRGQRFNVVWYFKEDDEDIRDSGRKFSSLTKIPIEILPY